METGRDYGSCVKIAEQPAHLKFVDKIISELGQFGLLEQNEIIWKVRDHIKGARKENIEKLNAEIEQINKSLIDF